ncbi:Acyl-ACP thioesterase [compost metagenome]
MGKATSKWVLIDKEKNKITKVTDDVVLAYEPEFEKEVFKTEDLSKIIEIEDAKLTAKYLVRKIDIDVNMHMHNLNYLDVAYEAMPDDIYLEGESNNVRITYKKEAKLGEIIKAFYSNINGKKQIVLKDEEAINTYCIIELS